MGLNCSRKLVCHLLGKSSALGRDKRKVFAALVSGSDGSPGHPVAGACKPWGRVGWGCSGEDHCWGGLPVVLVVKNPPVSAGDRSGFDPWVRKIPWRRAWQPTPVFLPGESHGQRKLAGCCPLGHTESDKTEATWHVVV